MNDALVAVTRTNLATLKSMLDRLPDEAIGEYVPPLRQAEKELGELLDTVSKRLKKHASPGATETHEVRVGDTKFSLQPSGKKWNDKHVLGLLRARKKDPARYMEVEYKATDEGMKTLQEEGVFTEADVEASKNARSWALKDVRTEKEVK